LLTIVPLYKSELNMNSTWKTDVMTVIAG